MDRLSRNFLLIVIFLLTGCSHVGNMRSLEEHLKDMAIVVCRAKSEEKVSRGKYWLFYPKTSFSFINREGNKFCIDDSSDEWCVLLVRPGIYKLSEISRSVESTTSSWYDYDCYFFVKSGEIVYINDLSFYPSTGRIKIVDKFEEAKGDVSKKLKNLTKKLQKRHYVSLGKDSHE